MAEAIYILAAAMCLLCTVLLLRQWSITRLKLLFWSGICFLTLTAANILLFVDRVLVPHIDLANYRNGTTLLAIIFMLYGLVMGRKDQ
jgi:hypothetical protein